ncbi:MAG: hypothetical protein FWF71_00260, partial [Actinomycetia bacterium]|nr:hypothetical protein [Actinomycetes bacterium]
MGVGRNLSVTESAIHQKRSSVSMAIGCSAVSGVNDPARHHRGLRQRRYCIHCSPGEVRWSAAFSAAPPSDAEKGRPCTAG